MICLRDKYDCFVSSVFGGVRKLFYFRADQDLWESPYYVLVGFICKAKNIKKSLFYTKIDFFTIKMIFGTSENHI